MEKIKEDRPEKLYCPKCKEITDYRQRWHYDEERRGWYFHDYQCQKCKYGLNKESEYSAFVLYPFPVKCGKCGKVHIFLTQPDDNPEYYTAVGIVCECGELVYAQLPVN